MLKVHTGFFMSPNLTVNPIQGFKAKVALEGLWHMLARYCFWLGKSVWQTSQANKDEASVQRLAAEYDANLNFGVHTSRDRPHVYM